MSYKVIVSTFVMEEISSLYLFTFTYIFDDVASNFYYISGSDEITKNLVDGQV